MTTMSRYSGVTRVDSVEAIGQPNEAALFIYNYVFSETLHYRSSFRALLLAFSLLGPGYFCWASMGQIRLARL